MQRAIDVFFYGLFMDRDALVAQGLHPGPARLASVEDYRLRIGARATLLPEEGGTVWGMIIALLVDEVTALYAAPSVADYRPEAILVRLESGETRAALCYNLPENAISGANRDYAESLHMLAERLSLPAAYLSFLASLTE